jgi:predicted RNase H-related nuclease YkuK (DUF458 family)
MKIKRKPKMDKQDIVTYRELIKEITALRAELTAGIKEIMDCVDTKVSYKTFSDVKTKTDKMWDERNRVIGYILGGGIVGGATSAAIVKTVTEVLAKL